MTLALGRDIIRCATALTVLIATAHPGRGDWREFRGNDGRGVSDAESVRSHWSESEGIAWKADLPGRGASSPIVVGDLVVVTAAAGAKQDKLHVVAFDAASGRQRWNRTFWATGRTFCHSTSSVAAGTPASDGGRIVALYSSCDLFCLDLDGRLLWQRNLAVEHPRTGNDIGMGASPRIIDGTVVVQLDCQGDAFVSGIDLATGRDRWTAPRDRKATWSSPLAVRLPGQSPSEPVRGALVQGAGGVELRDAASGSVALSWVGECAEIPMMTEHGGRLFVPGDRLTAVDVDESTWKPAWTSAKLACGIASPVAFADTLVTINRAGVLVVGDPDDGTIRGQLRLGGSFWASPVVAGEKVIAVNNDGKTFVVTLDGEPKIIAENQLPGSYTASPAVADGSLYLRSDTALWKTARE